MASEAYNIQKLANQSAKEIQQMVNSANKTTLNFNKTEAATARKFEKEMSNTSHQREVADLKKAGLNPVLSANSGAMSYTGASASAQAESGASSMSGIYGSLMNSITGLKQSQMSADAQLRTAQMSAAATRYAAQQSAQAQMYAADQNRAAQKYNAEMKYKTEMDKPQSTIPGIADKRLFSNNSEKNNFTKMLNNKKDAVFRKDGSISSYTGDMESLAVKGIKKLGVLSKYAKEFVPTYLEAAHGNKKAQSTIKDIYKASNYGQKILDPKEIIGFKRKYGIN